MTRRPPPDRNPWGQQSGRFKTTFQQVRTAFREEAPEILFAFSPALRFDTNEAVLTNYWPGDEFVDIIAGTWYVHGAAQFPNAKTVLRAYCLHRVGTSKPFGIDELSGRDDGNVANDQYISNMLHELEALQLQNVSFKYVTLFLSAPWGKDATLGLLT